MQKKYLCRLDELVLTKRVHKSVEGVSARHKARIALTRWGFESRCLAVLICGVNGTGKSVLSEAIAMEVGRPLKVLTVCNVFLLSSCSLIDYHHECDLI